MGAHRAFGTAERRLCLVLVAALGTGCSVSTVPPADASTGTDAIADAVLSICSPGSTECADGAFYRCNGDGTERERTECPEACDATQGCLDACELAVMSRAAMGCEYWAAPLSSLSSWDRFLVVDFDAFQYVVVLGNAHGTAAANVDIWRGDELVAQVSIPPASALAVPLPWIPELAPYPADGGRESIFALGAAYHIVADRPVSAVQFNPFEFSSGGFLALSSESSLLLPAHALGREYIGAAYSPATTFEDIRIQLPGYLALIGTSDEPTEVEVHVPTDVAAVPGHMEGAEGGGTLRFVLNRGDIAQLSPSTALRCDTLACAKEWDLTGATIRASRPIAAFGGHVCAFVPIWGNHCDHLETSLLPIDGFGHHYLSAPLVPPGWDGRAFVRVIAARDETHVVAQIGDERIEIPELDASDWHEIEVDRAFELTSDQPVQVVQYMPSGAYVEVLGLTGIADPAMTILADPSQYLAEYVFLTPWTFLSHALLVRPSGLEIDLDGEIVEAEWSAIGSYEVGRIPLSAGQSHRLTADEPFGLVVFGVDSLGVGTSYADLAGIRIQSPIE